MMVVELVSRNKIGHIAHHEQFTRSTAGEYGRIDPRIAATDDQHLRILPLLKWSEPLLVLIEIMLLKPLEAGNKVVDTLHFYSPSDCCSAADLARSSSRVS